MNNHIKDDSGDRKYFIVTPQFVWAKCRNPYDFTLWSVIKMIASEDGECYLNTKNLAKLAMMSVGKVNESRQYLLDARLLSGMLKPVNGNGQNIWHLTIPDIWRENIEWRQDHHSIPSRIAYKAENKSVHVVNTKRSPDEQKRSRGDDKEEPVRTTHKEKPSITPNGVSPPQKSSEAKTPIKEKEKPKRPPAVDTYRSVACRFPDKASWPLLEEVTDLEFWEQVIRHYIGCGWNKLNVTDMKKWYDRHELPTAKKNGATNGRQTQSGITGLKTAGRIEKRVNVAERRTYWWDTERNCEVPAPL